MNKDKYKKNYIAVLRAIKEASQMYLPDGDIRLYLTEKNGLANIQLPEIKDILTSLQDEEFIEIVNYPKMSILLHENNPITQNSLLPPMLQTLLLKKDPTNYYVIRFANLPGFNLLYAHYLIPIFLYSAIPSDSKSKKKYKVLRKMADLLIEAGYEGVESYKLAACITQVTHKKIVNNDAKTSKKKLTYKEYIEKKAKYDEQIDNRLKTLKKKLEEKGYTVKKERNKEILKIAEI